MSESEKDKKTAGRKKKIITDILAETPQSEPAPSHEPEKEVPFHFHSIAFKKMFLEKLYFS